MRFSPACERPDGFGERVIDRPVIERVALNPVNTHPGLEGPSLDGVRQRVAPAVVGIVAPTGDALGGSGEISGSGVVIRDDGIVVTSSALVPAGDDPVRVRLPDGTEKPARVIGTDATTGLSVLDLDGRGYTASVVAEEGDLVSGETSYAVGARAVVGTETTTGVVGISQRYVGPTGTALVGVQIDGEAPRSAWAARWSTTAARWSGSPPRSTKAPPGTWRPSRWCGRWPTTC